MILVVAARLAVSAVLVACQVHHLEGYNPGPPQVHALQNARTYLYVTDRKNQWLVCAHDAPSNTFAAVGHHYACHEKCLRSAPCVGFNFHWDSTKCELFNQVPTNFTYDNICVNYLVSL